jgi:hypothetical protein
LKPALASSSQDPYLERTHQKRKKKKRAHGVAQGIGPELKPQYSKKNKRKITKRAGGVLKR